MFAFEKVHRAYAETGARLELGRLPQAPQRSRAVVVVAVSGLSRLTSQVLTAARSLGDEALARQGLSSPTSAITSAIIFNALIIVALIPPTLRGVRYRPASGHDLLRRNLGVYGLGGPILPFAGIKLIDLVVSTIPGLG